MTLTDEPGLYLAGKFGVFLKENSKNRGKENENKKKNKFWKF